jgi:hypothetical protein
LWGAVLFVCWYKIPFPGRGKAEKRERVKEKEVFWLF